MRLVLALPAIAADGAAALATAPAFARLAAYAQTPARTPGGIGPTLLDVAGMPRETPSAPFAARGAGLVLADGDVQHADPVTFVAGRDDVLITGRVDDLSADDADALVSLLTAHFATDGLRFHAPRPDAWFLASAGVALPETTPLPDVQGAIAPHLPRGEQAKRWRRWISEMQMLVHEHPGNARRESEGSAPVTGVWLWGGGPAQVGAVPTALAILAPAGRDGDLARGLATRAAPTPARFADVALAGDTLVVMPGIRDGGAASAFARDWLAPAVASLEAGSLSSLTLVADDGRGTVSFDAPAPSWWRRTRARVGSGASAWPEPAP
jgi:hypothetical protein